MTASYKKSEKQKKESADGEYRLLGSKRQYILVASTVQMTVLLCFNSKDKFTVKELSRNVGSDVGTWLIFFSQVAGKLPDDIKINH